MLAVVTINRRVVIIIVLLCSLIITSVAAFRNFVPGGTSNSGTTYLPRVSEKILNKLGETEARELREFVAKLETSLVKQAKSEALVYNDIARNQKLPNPSDLGDPKKILILSASDYSNSSNPRWKIIQQSLQSRDEYASRYGFQHRFVNISNHPTVVEHPVWLKLPVIEETFAEFPEVEWIWWLDMDALIVNHEIDLRSHILHPSILKERLTHGRLVSNIRDSYAEGTTYPDGDELNVEDMLFIFTHDRISINAGSFFIKRSPLTDQVLKQWQNRDLIYDGDGNAVFARREQDAFIHIYFQNEWLQKRTALVAQPLMNSYPDLSKKEQAFRPGDFVVHFAGFWEYDSLVFDWPKYWKMARLTM